MSELSMDLVTAAHARLSAYAPFQQLVADGVIGSDDADIGGTVWLFQGLDNEGRPFRDPEGTGKVAVVLSEGGEWATANRHNTAYFPVLQMLVYADCDRNDDGSSATLNARRKAKHVFRILNRCFHLPNLREADLTADLNADPLAYLGDKQWGLADVGEGQKRVVNVHSSSLGSAFSLTDVPLTQSCTVRGEARYNTVTD